MKQLKGRFCALLAQQSGQIQFFIVAPILTLSFLSLLVRTANSALDPALAKRKVTEQLKHRLLELQNQEELPFARVVETPLIPQKKEDRSVDSLRAAPSPTLIWRAIGGRIAHSFAEAARSAGVPAQILAQVADMGWDLALASDLRPGDTFKVLFEEFRREEQILGYGQLLAAEIVHGGKPRTLFWPAPAEGRGGDLLRPSRQFLRYPLQFTRISSVFTDARLHPIFRRSRPHFGVDFAAPVGTPVRAVARGTVKSAGRLRGFGTCIRIDHPGPYATFYAHLRRVAAGVKAGATVARGQVIGYVGATGLATGPHLHFALLRDGQYVNPLPAQLPREETDTQPPQAVVRAELRRHLTAGLAALTVEDTAVSLVLPAAEDSPLVARTAFTPEVDGPLL
jgi:murein DD-endopeptidase MepM/ murein hydrolase activator NlpD